MTADESLEDQDLKHIDLFWQHSDILSEVRFFSVLNG